MGMYMQIKMDIHLRSSFASDNNIHDTTEIYVIYCLAFASTVFLFIYLYIFNYSRLFRAV